MNKADQQKVFDYFLANKIENFVGVPDSTLKHFIDQGLKKRKIIITTREDEAIGIATGMVISNSSSLVFMQNAGFANSISTLTSLIQLYKIPIIILLGWRGFLKNDAPEHTKIGKIQPQLIRSIGIKSKIIDEKNWKDACKWALKTIHLGSPCILIVKRIFND